jgi:hypothetical protein
MRQGRARARKDANQPELVRIIRQCGASYQHTHSIPGALDGIIGYCGIDQRVEIKDPAKPASHRRLTDSEHDVIASWRGRKPVVIETVEDIINLLGQMESEHGRTKNQR